MTASHAFAFAITRRHLFEPRTHTFFLLAKVPLPPVPVHQPAPSPRRTACHQTDRSLTRICRGKTGLSKVVKYRARKETENGVGDPVKNTPVPLPLLWPPEPA